MITNKKLAIKNALSIFTAALSISLLSSSRPEFKNLSISKKSPNSTTGKGRMTKDTSKMDYFRSSDSSSSNSPTQNRCNQETVPGKNNPKDNTVKANESCALNSSKSETSHHQNKKKKYKVYRSNNDRETFNISNQTHLILGEQLIIIDPKKYESFFRPYRK